MKQTRKGTEMIDKTKRSIATDAELEEGVLPLGATVHITTCTFAWRGRLEAVTASYYVLKGAVNVFRAGELSQYAKNKRGDVEESCGPGLLLVERSASVGIMVLE